MAFTGYTIFVDDEIMWSNDLADEYPLISPKCTIEANKAGSLEFTIPQENPFYNKLKKMKSVITLKQDTNVILWKGRVLHTEKDFYNRKQVYCEGALAYLNDSIYRPYDFHGKPAILFGQMISSHNSQVDEYKKFTQVDFSVTDPNDYFYRSNVNYTNVLSEINEKFVKPYNAFVYTTWWENSQIIHIRDTAIGVSDQVIEFGENLLDLTEYVTAENVFTSLIPLGAKKENKDVSEGGRLTIESINGGKDYIDDTVAQGIFGRITKTMEWDDVTEATNLLVKAQEALKSGVQMAVTLSIKAVDLHFLNVNTDRIKVLYYNRVVSLPHGLDTNFLCTKITMDLCNPDKTEYTFGAGFSAMTDQQVNALKNASNAYSIAESAYSTASSAQSAVVNVIGDYVSKATFVQYENNVEKLYAKKSDIASVYKVKGSVPTVSNLPSTARVGDVYNIIDTGANYVFTDEGWDKLSETMDLTGYALKESIPKNTSELHNDSGFIDSKTFKELVDRVALLENERKGE